MNEYPETTERTLADLRSEFGADTIEHYKAIAQTLVDDLNASNRDLKFHANRADRSESMLAVRKQDLKNFEESLRELLDADSESVEWERLSRPLKQLGIEIEQEWKANVSITVEVTVKAFNRDIAESILDNFRTYEVEINNSELESWSVEEVDWSDLEETDN